jgi:AcrR family transcriptional regulator
VTDVEDEHLPREERRRRTEAAILHAAQEQFAEAGFERTTIRSVASQAGIDPALVMQYFKSKEGLFAASARWTVDHKKLGGASLEELPETALEDLFSGFEDPERREAALALIRNCLTHPGAAEIMRDEVLCESQVMLAKTIGGDDGALRAGVLGACMIGLIISRYMLEVPEVAGASREDIERVLGPALKALVDPT